MKEDEKQEILLFVFTTPFYLHGSSNKNQKK